MVPFDTLPRQFGDETIERPWSKHSEGSSAYEQKHKSEAEKKEPKKKEKERVISDPNALKIMSDAEILREIKSGKNTELNEFVAAVKGRKAVKLWANDPSLPNTKLEIATVKNRKPGGEVRARGLFLDFILVFRYWCRVSP